MRPHQPWGGGAVWGGPDHPWRLQRACWLLSIFHSSLTAFGNKTSHSTTDLDGRAATQQRPAFLSFSHSWLWTYDLLGASRIDVKAFLLCVLPNSTACPPHSCLLPSRSQGHGYGAIPTNTEGKGGATRWKGLESLGCPLPP